MIEYQIKLKFYQLPFKVELNNLKLEDKLEEDTNKKVPIKIIFSKNQYNLDVIIKIIGSKLSGFNFDKINKVIIEKTTANTYYDILNEIKSRIMILSQSLAVNLLAVNLTDKLCVGTTVVTSYISYAEEFKKIDFTVQDVILDDDKICQILDKFF